MYWWTPCLQRNNLDHLADNIFHLLRIDPMWEIRYAADKLNIQLGKTGYQFLLQVGSMVPLL